MTGCRCGSILKLTTRMGCIKMDRRQALVSPLVFFAAAAQAQNSRHIISGKCKIPGDYSDLLHKGKPVGDRLKGKNLVVYFTTAHRTEGCVEDFMAIEGVVRDLERVLGKGRIVPVAIYPEADRADRSNLSLYIEKQGSMFVGLSGPKDTILSFARQYGVTYGANLESHTRFVYLMNPEGRNVKIVPPDVLGRLPVSQVLEFFQSEKHLPVCSP